MDKVVSIYDAKTNLSKLVKKAQAGEIIYIGAYGSAQAVLSPLPKKKKLNIGMWEHKAVKDAYKDEDLIEPDQDIIDDFEDSVSSL
jgi:antitoxin (DNA-binding transcriptional repressor) of toxin-antitoxin stability system